MLAIPGPVTSALSAGCHDLVRKGAATLVTDAAEVIDMVGELGSDALPDTRGETRPWDDLAPVTRDVLEAMPARKLVTVDLICRDTGSGSGVHCGARRAVAGRARRFGRRGLATRAARRCLTREDRPGRWNGGGPRREHPDLPPALHAAMEGFGVHLTAERDRSQHTVSAYVGDMTSLMDHLLRLGRTDLDGLNVAVLRSWLARQRTQGRSQATMARRASAARMFTAWAHREGLRH